MAEFHHFILRFNTKFPYFAETSEIRDRGERGEGIWGEREGEDRMTL